MPSILFNRYSANFRGNYFIMRLLMKILQMLSGVLLSLFLWCPLLSAQDTGGNVLQGSIYDGRTSKPVTFAVIVIKEAGVVTTTNQSGAYRIEVPVAGTYVVSVRSAGLNDLATVITIQGTVTRDFILNAAITGKKKTAVVTIRGERDIQTISRQTMTVKEIKQVPASFGDSISALTSLPGINRTGSFFGPLIIRGADSATNGYFIDGIPVFKMMHFGGIHSVISNDLMNSIDVYSSAFPAQFTSVQGAVFNINTVDEVKEEGGYADVGLISANALVKFPITSSTWIDGKEKKEKRGYVIASGRVGYMSIFIPYFYKYVMNEDLDYLPEYWDYQFKARYNFNSRHSLSFLAFGNQDRIDLQVKDSWVDPSDDPLFGGFEIYQNDQAHSQGLTYKYSPGERLSNSLMAFAALNKSTQWYNVPKSTADWAHDLGIKSTPYIYGLKDTLYMEWWKKHCALRAGAEARYYLFSTGGKTISIASDTTDLNDPDAVDIVDLGKTYHNQSLSGYLENRFVLGGLTFTPGVAAEYFNRTGKYYVDPRGLLSYTFRTGTTIGAAGGYYSMFLQTAPEYFTTIPNLAGLDFGAQKSIHRSVSLEQKIDAYTFKVEGFYNNFWNMAASDSYQDGANVVACYTNNARMKSAGVELLARISDEREQGLFGWVSYTYNRARYITRQSQTYTVFGDEWITSPYDMTHVVKIVAGYTLEKNTLSCKFQYNTATPYTAIVGSYQDTGYTASTRMVPVYGKPYTERLSPEYRLDVRYSRKINHKWGYVSWYIEAIGLVSSKSEQYKWDYRYAYESGNNPRIEKSDSITIIPNFGVEVKF